MAGKWQSAWFILGVIMTVLFAYDIYSRVTRPAQEHCINGVWYLEFPSGGVTPEWTKDSKIRTCE